MDEWTPDSMSCEDAKRVLQGIFLKSMAFLNFLLDGGHHRHSRCCPNEMENYVILDHIILGGMILIPQKHKGGLRVKYNSGFYIATNA